MIRKSLRYRRQLAYCLLFGIHTTLLQAETQSVCSATVRDIHVSGAEITQKQNLIRWSGLSVGQQVSARDLKKARQRLFDKSLFKEVTIEHADLCAESVTLTINIEEKIYHLVYPRLNRDGDGDISSGIRYRGSNLFGADQSLSIRYTQKDKSSGEESEQIDISYEIPMVSLPYIIRWRAETSDTLLNTSVNELHRLRDELKIQVGRNWLSHPFDRPIAVLAELRLESIALDGDSSLIETEPGNYNRLGISLEYDDIHEEKYRRFGRFFSIQLAQGSSLLDSDFSASQFKAEGLWFHRLNASDNLNARFVLELSSDKVFNEFSYSIGGFDNTRGIEEDSKEGNALWLTNIEYVLGYRRWPSFRTALFTDISNVFDKATTFHSDDWSSTFGIGLRWKLTSFVKTDLVIDYAYDPRSGYSKVYGSTSLLF